MYDTKNHYGSTMSYPGPILRTKIYPPQMRPGIIQRPRLVHLLDRGANQKLTLISAPAGFGKTTLLTAWIAKQTLPSAWFSFDENDNDPIKFIRYLIASLQTIHPHIGTAIAASLQTQPTEAFSPNRTLTPLLNDIHELPEQFALILEDYHKIETPEIHKALEFLIEHLPAQLHLIIATRTDPPLPLARLRSQGELREIRVSDLRFTLDEAVEFFRAVYQVDLSPAQVQKLNSRAEGWIAGLQMAALSMQNRVDTSAFIESFTGSHEFIADYLVEEVLQGQTERTRRFLLFTSILPRLSDSLCEALVGGDTGAEELAYLNDKNLFIMPLDTEKKWYRYHQLFADLLHKRLLGSYPSIVPELHKKAGRWFLGKGLFAEALEHLILGDELDEAANLIEEIAERTLMRSEVITLLNWIRALPENAIRSRPKLCTYYGGALLLSGQPKDQVTTWLEQAEKIDTDGRYSGEISAFYTLLTTFQGDIQGAISRSEQAMGKLPKENLFLRGLVSNNQGILYTLTDELDKAMRAFEQTYELGQKADNLLASVSALSNLAGFHVLRCQMDLAEKAYQRALKLATDKNGDLLPVASRALLGLGEIKREQNELQSAAEYLNKAIERFQHIGDVGVIIGMLTLARVKSAQVDFEEALDLVDKARVLAFQFDASQLDDLLVNACHLTIAAEMGDVDTTRQITQNWGLYQETCLTDQSITNINFSPSPQVKEIEIKAISRVYIAEGRYRDAIKLLSPEVDDRTRKQSSRYLIKILAMLAVAYENAGYQEAALNSLSRALALTQGESYMRVFLDEGAVMASLLAHNL
jgi:LuxR family maltose regulon positive regulatory protein